MKNLKRQEITISRPFVGEPQKKTVSLPVRLALYLLRIRGEPPSFRPRSNPIKVVCVSDTHNITPPLHAGDILIHSGDLSQYGTFQEIQRQLEWLKSLPHKYKIVVAGNHDLLLDAAFVDAHLDRELNKAGASARDLDWGDIIYLENRSIEITCGARTLRIFGSPSTPRCGNFAFQYDPLSDVWAGQIPVDTDIVVTHGPPALHLDGGGKGCPSLLKELWTVRPQLVVFGHIHHARGRETMTLNSSQRLFENIALDGNSWTKLPLLLWSVCVERFYSRPDVKTISLVNAACQGDQGCIVVEI